MAKKSNRVLWAEKLAGKGPKVSGGGVMSGVNRRAFEGIVLGIDPSLRGTGLALVEFGLGKPPILHRVATVRMKRALSMAECLGGIHREVTGMLAFGGVRHVALEQTIFVQNFQTAQVLGAARGAAIAAAAILGVPVFEYPPLRVKQAVVGFGRASKEQMSKMVMQYFNHEAPLPFDEADAVSIALCHAFTWRGVEVQV